MCGFTSFEPFIWFFGHQAGNIWRRLFPTKGCYIHGLNNNTR